MVRTVASPFVGNRIIPLHYAKDVLDLTLRMGSDQLFGAVVGWQIFRAQRGLYYFYFSKAPFPFSFFFFLFFFGPRSLGKVVFFFCFVFFVYNEVLSGVR